MSKITNQGKPYTAKTVNFLILNAGVTSVITIAKKLGRSVKGVRRKAEKLGLSLRVA